MGHFVKFALFRAREFSNMMYYNAAGLYGHCPPVMLQSERDLGTVSCVATNSVGRMEEERSCVFHVILARRPTPPANCSVIEGDPGGRPRMGLTCQPGFGGGLDQVGGCVISCFLVNLNQERLLDT